MRPSLRQVRAAGRPSLARLTSSVRAGDRAAARTLRRRLVPEAVRLAVILVDDPLLALRLAGRAVDEALAYDGPVRRWAGDPRAEVMAALQEHVTRFVRQKNEPSRSTEERMALVVSELCDRQGRSHRQTATHLGLPLREIDRLHRRALSDAGGRDLAEPRCAGWSLVRRLPQLTAPEAAAAHGHLRLCRPCSDAHQARLLARRRLRIAAPAAGGTAAAGGAWAALSGGASSLLAPAAGGAAAAALGGLALLGPGIGDINRPVAPPTAEVTGVLAATGPDADPVPTAGVTTDRAPKASDIPPVAAPRPPASTATASAGSADDPRPATGGPGPSPTSGNPVPTSSLPTPSTLPSPLLSDSPDPVTEVTKALPIPLPTVTILDPLTVVTEAVSGAASVGTILPTASTPTLPLP